MGLELYPSHGLGPINESAKDIAMSGPPAAPFALLSSYMPLPEAAGPHGGALQLYRVMEHTSIIPIESHGWDVCVQPLYTEVGRRFMNMVGDGWEVPYDTGATFLWMTVIGSLVVMIIEYLHAKYARGSERITLSDLQVINVTLKDQHSVLDDLHLDAVGVHLQRYANTALETEPKVLLKRANPEYFMSHASGMHVQQDVDLRIMLADIEPLQGALKYTLFEIFLLLRSGKDTTQTQIVHEHVVQAHREMKVTRGTMIDATVFKHILKKAKALYRCKSMITAILDARMAWYKIPADKLEILKTKITDRTSTSELGKLYTALIGLFVV
jgi:hypothetical protein